MTTQTQTQTPTLIFMHVPHPHCIAVSLERVAQETKIMRCKANKEMHLQSEDEGRHIMIARGETFYLVRSESCTGWWYVVSLRMRNGTQVWACSCPSHKPCKHERMLGPVLRARALVETERAAKAQERHIALEKMEIAADIELLEELAKERAAKAQATAQKREQAECDAASARRQHAALNGNRGFSLMR